MTTLSRLIELRWYWRRVEWKFAVGMTNGCFDLFHPGHRSLLQFMRRKCDKTIVAINSDASVRRLKGVGRPVNDAKTREQNLYLTGLVDAVIVFDEETPLELIKVLQPDRLVKGSDYAVDAIVGADVVKKFGGKILTAPYLEGHSTTNIVSMLNRSKS